MFVFRELLKLGFDRRIKWENVQMCKRVLFTPSMCSIDRVDFIEFINAFLNVFRSHGDAQEQFSFWNWKFWVLKRFLKLISLVYLDSVESTLQYYPINDIIQKYDLGPKMTKVIVKLKNYFVEQCFNNWVHSAWYTIMLLFEWSDNWTI